MSDQQRHRVPVDVHLILRRDTSTGPEVLLSRRAGDVYATGLFDEFLAGYGRSLTGAEEGRLAVDTALDAVSGIAYGAAHGDPELVERALRTLARLRAEHEALPSSTGDPW